jgi:hypothetical protein
VRRTERRDLPRDERWLLPLVGVLGEDLNRFVAVGFGVLEGFVETARD